MLRQTGSLLQASFVHENGESEVFEQQLSVDPSKPINVYYQIDGFHQNIRSYVASMDAKQLSSADFSASGLDETCAKTRDPAKVVNYPCGLIYKTRVTDSYVVRVNGQVV